MSKHLDPEKPDKNIKLNNGSTIKVPNLRPGSQAFEHKEDASQKRTKDVAYGANVRDKGKDNKLPPTPPEYTQEAIGRAEKTAHAKVLMTDFMRSAHSQVRTKGVTPLPLRVQGERKIAEQGNLNDMPRRKIQSTEIGPYTGKEPKGPIMDDLEISLRAVSSKRRSRDTSGENIKKSNIRKPIVKKRSRLS